ncbi:MAG: heme A synthase [Clostridia bacterium]|nr:heme A synthase [Clostridia bacterium]
MSARRLATLTVAAMYLVLVMGALVTNTGSATGCGNSWPLCNGQVFPVPNFHTMVEYGHRLVTGAATVLVLWLAVVAWRGGRPRRDRAFAVMAVGFLVLESILGAAAVMWPEPPEVLATHFGVSLLSYSGVLLLAFSMAAAPLAAGPASAGERLVRRLSWAALVYTFVLIYSGAYVRHTGSFCVGWPLCDGTAIPAFASREFPQFLHRLGAGALLVLLAYLWHAAARLRAQRPDLSAGAGWAFAFGILQALSGAIVVFSGVSAFTAMIHAMIVPLLFGAELYVALRSGFRYAPSRDASSRVPT